VLKASSAAEASPSGAPKGRQRGFSRSRRAACMQPDSSRGLGFEPLRFGQFQQLRQSAPVGKFVLDSKGRASSERGSAMAGGWVLYDQPAISDGLCDSRAPTDLAAASTSWSPAIDHRSVDFPQPDAAEDAANSPSRTSRETGEGVNRSAARLNTWSPSTDPS